MQSGNINARKTFDLDLEQMVIIQHCRLILYNRIYIYNNLLLLQLSLKLLSKKYCCLMSCQNISRNNSQTTHQRISKLYALSIIP